MKTLKDFTTGEFIEKLGRLGDLFGKQAGQCADDGDMDGAMKSAILSSHAHNVAKALDDLADEELNDIQQGG